MLSAFRSNRATSLDFVLGLPAFWLGCTESLWCLAAVVLIFCVAHYKPQFFQFALSLELVHFGEELGGLILSSGHFIWQVLLDGSFHGLPAVLEALVAQVHCSVAVMAIYTASVQIRPSVVFCLWLVDTHCMSSFWSSTCKQFCFCGWLWCGNFWYCNHCRALGVLLWFLLSYVTVLDLFLYWKLPPLMWCFWTWFLILILYMTLLITHLHSFSGKLNLMVIPCASSASCCPGECYYGCASIWFLLIDIMSPSLFFSF